MSRLFPGSCGLADQVRSFGVRIGAARRLLFLIRQQFRMKYCRSVIPGEEEVKMKRWKKEFSLPVLFFVVGWIIAVSGLLSGDSNANVNQRDEVEAAMSWKR